MDFAFTPEQDELRATVRTLLRRGVTSARVRAADGFDAPLWTQITGQLGLTALAIDEKHGGFGASLVEVAVAVAEIGAALAPVPYLSTVVAAAALDPDGPAAEELLPGLAAGTLVATLAVTGAALGPSPTDPSCLATRGPGETYRLDGAAGHVLDGQIADLAIVAARCEGEVGLFAVRATDAQRDPLPTLDQTRGQARWGFWDTPAVRVSPVGDGGAAASRAMDLLYAALAVESVGVGRASLARTIEYLKTREQFGVPLATFQALRHRVADLVVSLEAATSSAWYAIRAAGTDEFAVAAPLAKVVAARAAYEITAESIQLHGGIGFTWEHDAHLYFKRATANQLLAGDEVSLRRIIGARVGLG